ncbi:hypoxanthine-guanine phosphoribosyltransferase [Methyloradius palustris]|nr:hypoxanthine-guanine phosphoribosyltransferase [Methyloradius palustris]
MLASASLIHTADAVGAAIDRLALELTEVLHDKQPLIISVMGGAVVFSGQLLPKLQFPLEFNYVQASRYHNQTVGKEVLWKVTPGDDVIGRTVLLLDDILDEGHTLAAIKAKCLELGAKQVLIAVLTEKELGHAKPVQADFVGLTVPNRYVFGCGMDVYGWWRNLPAIYALND